MKKLTWIIFILVYLGALLVNAPAILLGVTLKHLSNGRIELANAQGSIWSGTANPILHQRSGGLISLSSLHWKLSPLAMFHGQLAMDLKWDDEVQIHPMKISVSHAKVELHHAYIPLSADLLDEVSDFLKPAQLRGQVILRSDSLIITPEGALGIATADWINASSLLSSITPLGNYHFTFSSSPSGVEIKLETTSGALILGGQGRLTSTGLEFKGTAQAANGKNEALRELLGHLGPEEKPGVNTFNLVPTRPH